MRPGPVSNKKQGAIRRARPKKQLPGKNIKNPNYGGGVPPTPEPLDGLPSFDPDGSPVGPGPAPAPFPSPGQGRGDGPIRTIPPFRRGRPIDRNGAKPGLGWGRGGRWGGGGRARRPHRIPQQPQGPSLNDQFQAFLDQDPSAIGIGTTLGLRDLYQGPQDFLHGGNAYDAGDTMTQTIRNKFLNTLGLQDRARAQNHMGYYTGGQRVNAPQGGFQYSGSLPELGYGESWQPQVNGVAYGTYSRGDEASGGGYSWDAIGDQGGAYGVEPGTVNRLPGKRGMPPRGPMYRAGRTKRRGPGRPRY